MLTLSRGTRLATMALSFQRPWSRVDGSESSVGPPVCALVLRRNGWRSERELEPPFSLLFFQKQKTKTAMRAMTTAAPQLKPTIVPTESNEGFSDEPDDESEREFPEPELTSLAVDEAELEPSRLRAELELPGLAPELESSSREEPELLRVMTTAELL
jgi:hypothetical protein